LTGSKRDTSSHPVPNLNASARGYEVWRWCVSVGCVHDSARYTYLTNCVTLYLFSRFVSLSFPFARFAFLMASLALAISLEAQTREGGSGQANKE